MTRDREERAGRTNFEMISFSIFEVERQKFFIHATCFVILVNLNLIIFLFCPHFKYLPFPNVCHSSLYSAVKNIVSRIQNILSGLLQKHQAMQDIPDSWWAQRRSCVLDCKKKPDYFAVDGASRSDLSCSRLNTAASIPNKYNPWICFVFVFHLRYIF